LLWIFQLKNPLSKTRYAAYSFGSTSLFFKLGGMVTRPFSAVKNTKKKKLVIKQPASFLSKSLLLL
ncbi:MAG: hypothetical protein KC433_13895, partial [Anaerolineales bacterium]|nr:hypothetical protein [Anaerolineales bacterium]